MIDENQTKILACPFCGESGEFVTEIFPKISGWIVTSKVSCFSCGAQGPDTTLWQGPRIKENSELFQRAEAEAKKYWNSRT